MYLAPMQTWSPFGANGSVMPIGMPNAAGVPNYGGYGGAGGMVGAIMTNPIGGGRVAGALLGGPSSLSPLYATMAISAMAPTAFAGVAPIYQQQQAIQAAQNRAAIVRFNQAMNQQVNDWQRLIYATQHSPGGIANSPRNNSLNHLIAMSNAFLSGQQPSNAIPGIFRTTLTDPRFI